MGVAAFRRLQLLKEFRNMNAHCYIYRFWTQMRHLRVSNEYVSIRFRYDKLIDARRPCN
jgi:hypothetical protein